MTHNKRPVRAITTLFLFASFVVLLAQLPARAGGPVVWELNSRDELLRGEARGVSVTDTGALMIAPRFAQVFDTQQAYVWSTAADAGGNVYLGTGHDGRIFRVAADGRGALLYDAAELDVTALAVGKDGALYAGTSPDGKVYRIAAGAGAPAQAEVFFDPPDKYVWSLAVMPDGALAVGTGDAGKIYRVRAAGAKAEESLLVDINETHVMSLAVDARGDLVAGTDPGGLVIRVNAQGKPFALFDAPLREIHSLASAPDGSIYVLALGEAASSARPQGAVTASSAAGAQATVSTVTMTVTDDGTGQAAQIAAPLPSPARSRNELANARSAVFRLLADGGSDVLWSSPSVTAFSVAPAPQGGVLIGTSDKGRIYHVTDDGRDTLLIQSSEDQISSLVVRGREVLAASSNQGKLFRLTPETAAGEGTYESPVRDARFTAAWGRIWWRGRGAVELQTRTGNTERPDQTWSEWSAPYRASAGAPVASPRARFIQWRAVLRSQAGAASGGEAARVEGVSVAYLPRNVAPEIVQVTTLPVGVALLPAVQVQTDPNLEASGFDAALIAPVPQVPPRRAYQRGAVAVQWQAEDRNGDTLEYAIYYRALGETDFHLLRENLRENFFTVDGAALGDGRYVFRVVATDAPDNSVGAALMGERTSEPVEIDNRPPVVRAAGSPAAQANGSTSISFTAEDAGGMIRRADVSVNGGPWRAVFPEDGIADSPSETFRLSLPLEGRGEHIVALRVFDAGGNTGNARVVVRK
jgi:hypothetical protein